MKRKIYSAILLSGVIIMFLGAAVAMITLYNYYTNIQEQQLKDEFALAATGVSIEGETFLKELDSDSVRVTWIAADGTVLYDTQANEQEMENHADRQEVREALEFGTGMSVRYSGTMLEETVNYAGRLKDGTVLRVSSDRAAALTFIQRLAFPGILLLILLAIVSFLLAGSLSASIVKPMNDLDLEHPLDNDIYEELSPLLRRISKQQDQINEQLNELKRRTDEFNQITNGMYEGLILLDNNGKILSINPAAARIFRTNSDVVGKDFLTVERDHEISTAIRTAESEGHSEISFTRTGMTYQLDAALIRNAEKPAGIVLLIFDITARVDAEAARREFTANVSHELKTPLQGIIGSTELLENGMVQAEDIPRFISHIHKEAERLTALISDLIRLSKLDEGAPMDTETCDLYDLAQESAKSLQSAAETKNVTLTVSGNSASVTGVRRLLYEIIYDLTDNAIKYNKDGGSVEIKIQNGDDKAIITVRDTGIGIPLADQAHVFERFYRADKSRCKTAGGTGLGLSIVKHAVLYHKGTVSLNSIPGSGTEITVTLPRN